MNIHELYYQLSLVLQVAKIAGEEYPSLTLHQDEIQILLKLLEEKMEDEE